MKFTSIPQTIDEVQWRGDNLEEILGFLSEQGYNLTLAYKENDHLMIKMPSWPVADSITKGNWLHFHMGLPYEFPDDQFRADYQVPDTVQLNNPI